MSQAIIEKAVDGKFPIGLKLYSPDLESSETISTVTATVSPPGLTLGIATKSGDEVSVEISEGVAGKQYIVQFKITISSGKIFCHPQLNSILVKVVY